jgi:hypothetical protein
LREGQLIMFTDLNKRLEEIKEKQWKKRKYEEHLERVSNFLKGEREKARILGKQLKKEQADVKRLESLSLTNVIYTIIGKKLEKLDKEQQEALAAELKYEEALVTIAEVEEEISELTNKLQVVLDADDQYKQLLLDKEKLILDKKSIWSEELYSIADQQAELTASLKEYNEAIDAGDAAAKALSKAKSSLESASGWSTWDMIGGGMITTAIKHSHIDDAQNHVHTAQTQLRWFQDELADVVNHDKLELEIGGMLTFADYLFDGLIVDWVVHGKINDSLKQVEETNHKVEGIIRELKLQRSLREQDLRLLNEKRTKLLENA